MYFVLAKAMRLMSQMICMSITLARVRALVFKAFNNISAISRRSVLLVEETGVSVENHRPAKSH
jgi:small basic protein